MGDREWTARVKTDDGREVSHGFTHWKLHEHGELETWWENSEGRRTDVRLYAPGDWRNVKQVTR